MKLIKDKRRLNIISNLLTEFTPYCGVDELQRANDLHVDSLFGNDTFKALYKELLDSTQVDFNGHFYPSEYGKNQIVLHHTAGWDNARGVFEWWEADKVKHVATAIAINDEGAVYRGFSEDYWAHHIGAKTSHFNKFGLTNINSTLNKKSVALEICNWGQLTKKNGKFYTYLGNEFTGEVAEVSYRGFNYFEAYTDKEIETARKWILLMSIRYNIPLDYNADTMWNTNEEALSGKKGIFTHGSFRDDKVDIYPHPKMVEMLKNLN